MTKRKVITSSSAKGPQQNIFTGTVTELTDKLSTINNKFFDSQLNNAFVGDKYKTVEDAINKFNNGDEKLFQKYKEQEKTMLLAPVASKSYYAPSTEGLFYSIPAYLEGQPEHWLTEETEPAPGKISDLYINISLPSSQDQTTVFNKLIKVVELIDAAEQQGQRLNVFLCAHSDPSKDNKHRERYTFNLQIKRDSEPLNLQQLVYLIATPVVLRYAVLGLISEFQGFSAGVCVQDSEEENKLIDRADVLYIPSFYYDRRNAIYSYRDLKQTYPHLIDRI